jgi:hypothetical protein
VGAAHRAGGHDDLEGGPARRSVGAARRRLPRWRSVSGFWSFPAGEDQFPRAEWRRQAGERSGAQASGHGGPKPSIMV